MPGHMIGEVVNGAANGGAEAIGLVFFLVSGGILWAVGSRSKVEAEAQKLRDQGNETHITERWDWRKNHDD